MSSVLFFKADNIGGHRAKRSALRNISTCILDCN
jgi:hypothetical protein